MMPKIQFQRTDDSMANYILSVLEERLWNKHTNKVGLVIHLLLESLEEAESKLLSMEIEDKKRRRK